MGRNFILVLEFKIKLKELKQMLNVDCYCILLMEGDSVKWLCWGKLSLRQDKMQEVWD